MYSLYDFDHDLMTDHVLDLGPDSQHWLYRYDHDVVQSADQNDCDSIPLDFVVAIYSVVVVSEDVNALHFGIAIPLIL